MERITLLVPALLILGLGTGVGASGEVPDFDRDIRPILSDNCYQCHGPDGKKRKADLRLDTKEGALADLGGYAAVVPNHPEQSELVARIKDADPEKIMPPPKTKRSLTPKQIETLEAWIARGAPWTKHWAFEKPERPDLPVVRKEDWPRNAIDHFILARLENEGLRPSPRATKEQLIRRVTLDLTGLPPALEAVDDFIADRSPDAYERVVDRLLASPRYGERMAWEWMDAARYADSNGYQGDPERTMWPWRDWVVRALNENMPFDQFTIEQLAGDLLPKATLDQRIATGFNRNHMHNGEGGRIAEETRVENLFDRTETTGTIWLGLTLTCARCHDHKFDPVTQREYYQLLAFFNRTPEDGGGRGGKIAPFIDLATPEEKERVTAAQEKVDRLGKEVDEAELAIFPRPEGKPSQDSPRANDFSGNIYIGLAQPAGKRGPEKIRQMVSDFESIDPKFAKLLQELESAMDALDGVRSRVTGVMVMEDEAEPRETFMLQRGAYDHPGDSVSPGVPEILPAFPATSPPNRLSLAQWLVDPGHPLASRVTVNRSWQTFFGRGIVKTAEDFGAQGSLPAHRALLDWLAVEFVESGWDVKAMHRLIVTSAAYQQQSRVTPELRELDPENVLLARGPRNRLPSWMLRDQALAASGLLVETVGGPPVNPYQPEGIWQEATFGKKTYVQDHGDALYRRSLYIFWRRIVGPTMFFDTANRQTCSVKTSLTNTPLHALTLLNETGYVEAARAMAERVMTTAPADEDRINTAFRLAAARHPNSLEMEIIHGRLNVLRNQYGADRDAALKLLSVGESERNEELDPVEHAAFAGICSMILNLDETVSKQ